MPTTNDRPEPRQFVRRLTNPATAPASAADMNTATASGALSAPVQLADLVEEFERWDGLS